MTIISLFLIGCSEYEMANNLTEDVGHDLEIVDVVTETMPTGDTGDTGVEDTAVVDTGTQTVCEFPVVVWDLDRTDGETYPEAVEDTVMMENELYVFLSRESPSGDAVPGYGKIFEVHFQAVHLDCPDITVSSSALSEYVTDNEGSLWYDNHFAIGFDQFNETTGELIGDPIMEDGAMTDVDDALAFLTANEFTIPAGSTYTIAWYGDTTGASASWDDAVQMDIEPDSIAWTDGTNEVVMYHERVQGNALFF